MYYGFMSFICKFRCILEALATKEQQVVDRLGLHQSDRAAEAAIQGAHCWAGLLACWSIAASSASEN